MKKPDVQEVCERAMGSLYAKWDDSAATVLTLGELRKIVEEAFKAQQELLQPMIDAAAQMDRSLMREHSLEVRWFYVVPPFNVVRVVITQRQDGPYSGDVVGGPGYYYTSVQKFDKDWGHVVGSATGGHRSFEEAYAVAERQWKEQQS